VSAGIGGYAIGAERESDRTDVVRRDATEVADRLADLRTDHRVCVSAAESLYDNYAKVRGYALGFFSADDAVGVFSAEGRDAAISTADREYEANQQCFTVGYPLHAKPSTTADLAPPSFGAADPTGGRPQRA
jgi:hypothetical protein